MQHALKRAVASEPHNTPLPCLLPAWQLVFHEHTRASGADAPLHRAVPLAQRRALKAATAHDVKGRTQRTPCTAGAVLAGSGPLRRRTVAAAAHSGHKLGHAGTGRDRDCKLCRLLVRAGRIKSARADGSLVLRLFRRPLTPPTCLPGLGTPRSRGSR